MTRNRVEDWHVFADGEWVLVVYEGYAPVSVWVGDKLREVMYRHRAVQPSANCPLCQ